MELLQAEACSGEHSVEGGGEVPDCTGNSCSVGAEQDGNAVSALEQGLGCLVLGIVANGGKPNSCLT